MGDVAQPDQARIVTHNASFFLKNNGWILISIKASCVDSTAAPEAVFAAEVDRLRKDGCKPKEQLTLEPYHRDHALVAAVYRASKKKKVAAESAALSRTTTRGGCSLRIRSLYPPLRSGSIIYQYDVLVSGVRTLAFSIRIPRYVYQQTCSFVSRSS